MTCCFLLLRDADRYTLSKCLTRTCACAQVVMAAAGCTVSKQNVANGPSYTVCCSWRRLQRLQSRSWSAIGRRAQTFRPSAHSRTSSARCGGAATATASAPRSLPGAATGEHVVTMMQASHVGRLLRPCVGWPYRMVSKTYYAGFTAPASRRIREGTSHRRSQAYREALHLLQGE